MFQRRRHQRVKRRFACEFRAEGQLYRGIVVELSQGGLFVQTDATTTPGSPIELRLAGAGIVPDLVLRGRVVRRRMVPAPLASVVRRGIAVELLEAPREYGLAFGSTLLDAPIGTGAASVGEVGAGGAPRAGEVEAGGAPTQAVSTQVFEPWIPKLPEMPISAPRSPRRPARAADEEPDEAPRPDALVVDDGHLADVIDLLRELGADAERIQIPATGVAPILPRPSRLFVTTARLACSLHLPDRIDEDGLVGIVVADDGSHTLSALMRRLGFQFLVRRPTHPDALRLLLRKSLYRGAEQRSAERHPFGARVRWSSGWMKRSGILVEISATGCRLRSERALAPGSRIRIAIEPTARGDRRLTLRGRVLRRSAGTGGTPEAGHELAVGFEPVPPRVQKRLDALLGRLARGPVALPCEAPHAAPDAADAAPDALQTAPNAPPPASASAPPEAAETDAPRILERRERPRVRLDREVVALDATGTRVLHALVGRDLSPRGMRVDPHPELALGGRVHLALYEPSSPEPIRVDAEVVRDDGGAGLALGFLDLAPEISEQLDRILSALPAMESLRPAPTRIVLGELVGERPAA